jgi:hypothetical protein
MKLDNRTQVALKILGFFGMLDLPFYVIFPQIGLQHWIFLGGGEPEPLLGARKMGIPDPIFYLIVVLTTLGLIFLYFENIRVKVANKIRTLLVCPRGRRLISCEITVPPQKLAIEHEIVKSSVKRYFNSFAKDK